MSEEMREALETLRKETALLLQNAEGCAANHYGNDIEIHGMPGWIADCRYRIATALSTLREQTP